MHGKRLPSYKFNSQFFLKETSVHNVYVWINIVERTFDNLSADYNETVIYVEWEIDRF